MRLTQLCFCVVLSIEIARAQFDSCSHFHGCRGRSLETSEILTFSATHFKTFFRSTIAVHNIVALDNNVVLTVHGVGEYTTIKLHSVTGLSLNVSDSFPKNNWYVSWKTKP